VVINGDSIIARQFAVAVFLRDMEAKSELPSSEQGLKALKFTAGRLADISLEKVFEAFDAALPDPESKGLIITARFAGDNAREAAEDSKRIMEKIDRNLNMIDRNTALTAGANACLDLAAASSGLLHSHSAANAMQAKAYVYLAEESAKQADNFVTQAIETFDAYPLDDTVRSSVSEITALSGETSEKASSCRKDFKQDWVTPFILEADGTAAAGSYSSLTADYSTSTTPAGNAILSVTIVDPENNHDMEFRLKDRKLVSVTDKTEAVTVETDSHNTSFMISSDGSSIWTVDMPDGSGVVLYDRYTAQSTYSMPEGMPEWSWKLTEFVGAFDSSELEGEYTESFRNNILVKKVMEGVTEFFSRVVQAYQYALQEQISAQEQEEIEYYMPFVQMLEMTNPMILVSGGIGSIASWIVAQGAHITNCAMKSLLGYFEGQDVTLDTEERISVSAVISDVLFGLITPASVGEIETTMFTLKSIAAASGITLHGVRTGLDGMAGRQMPVIALVEEAMQNHMVLVRSVEDIDGDGHVDVDEKVTYVSDGMEITVSGSAFREKFRGCVLSPEPADAFSGGLEMTDEDLMKIAGSVADILEVKTDNLVDYLGSLKDYMDEIKENISLSVNSIQAGQ
ncbi:MAG: hypothetical protein KAS86_02435, partial [Candidatus Omnitrophica bacterium]|nr:hypothetical protein [Candidatus Omnitrophota bacterium]